jgi:hypothetical protein
MNPQPAAWVATDLHLRLVVPGGAAVPVDAQIRYDCADPYAVTMAFHAGGTGAVEWTFARQLLSDGIVAVTGEGDVRVWPASPSAAIDPAVDPAVDPAYVCLSLSSPSGAALFEAPFAELLEFLIRTYALVPTGVESDHVDLDAELALLLWSGVDD